MYGLIYCATNVVNGKQYVGQTTLSLDRRWQGHLNRARDGSQGALHCAIRKYGAEAFKVEQIDFAETLVELNKKEARYILQLATLASGGYNLTTGGEGFKVSEETRNKLSELMTERTGWRHSEETKKKISQQHWHHSGKTKQKLSQIFTRECCKREHVFDEVSIYRDYWGRRHCLVCHYLSHGLKLPVYLRKYVTGKEVFTKRLKEEKIAHGL